MIIELLALLGLLCFLAYRWIAKHFGKWEKEGVVHDKPSWPFGTHNLMAKHLHDCGAEDYKKWKIDGGHKFHGWYLFGKPTLSINDPELLKLILVKDFNHFVDRNEVHTTRSFQTGGKLDKLWGLGMDNAVGEHWKGMRSSFTPIFTSGKMKLMLKFINSTSTIMTEFIEKKAKIGEEFDLKDVFGRYSLDGLAACAFGVDTNSFQEEEEPPFVKSAKLMFQNDTATILGFVLKFIPGFSRFCEMFNINLIQPKATTNLTNIIRSSLNARKKTEVRRNDLVDMMLDILKEEQSNHVLTEDEIISNCLILLTAGYDTTGMTLSYLTYALSKNPDVQDRLKEEVDMAFDDNSGELPDYTVIQGLPYLDMVIHETLRFFNPVGLNTRSCTADWRIPETDITIRKDDFISFSIMGLHRDPEYWSHPEEFYPEHFSKEEKATRNPYVYQAFGGGQRNCIGMRFAMLEAKVAMLQIMRKFTFLPGTKTLEPVINNLDVGAVLGWVKGGVWAKVQWRRGS